METRSTKADAISFKVARNLSMAPARKDKGACTFKFQKDKKDTLYVHDAKLSNGGKVQVTVNRRQQEDGLLKSQGTPKEEGDKHWHCTVKQWNGTVHSKEPVILNNAFQYVYPGAVYAYENIANGSFTPVAFARKPFSVNIDSVHFKRAAAKVEHPSRSTVRQAMANIVRTQTGKGSAHTYGRKFEVFSEEDLFLRTGGSGYFLGFGGSDTVQYKDRSKTYKYYMEIYQSYYTISVDDTLTEPSDFFHIKGPHNDVKDAVAEKDIDPNWVYVDSVTYGRMLQVMIQSDQSFDAVKIDVEAHANFLVAGGEGSFNMDQQHVLDNSSIEIVAVGGNPIYSGRTLNGSTRQEIKRRIDQFFAGTHDEEPIAYSLRTLDQEAVGMSLITDFTSRQCAPRASKYAITWDHIFCANADDASGAEDVRAMVRIRAFSGKGEDILDVDKYNQPILALAPVARTGVKIPLPWTFAKGTEDAPIEIDTGQLFKLGKKIVFNIDNDDEAAKLAIRADILEYDGIGNANDHFAEDLWEARVNEITGEKKVTLLCTDDASKILFHFTISPVYS